MHLRQALLLSSQDAASYQMVTIPGYLLHVTSKQEEYEPVIRIYSGPYYTTQFTLTIRRDDSTEKATEPHVVQKFTDLDALEAYLQTWRIDVDDMWSPDEPDVEAPKRLGRVYYGE